ncbi:hypothetical protein E3Q08_02203 [Wallemia mellicola]|uniref:Mitochondrial ATP synthase epsilon chain domain-containing protein n=1 Tax=Wallemia mellicola TaxID=1708541 RepID=A0AB74KEJ0_9BASI|nr:hypothetical protein E3Q16_01736 [Wallemia mellicola]TIC08350.1 hypothetical protein E3Q15_04033 [Wallemia mellicola]TIC21520.1 hypothetical protein E3Q12_03371 [Wallemia mellicola]TIC31815.1 hypothetical protein E3Q09_03914 [Wallemia mellicola]TIC43859.1 hypothetical protein E3Q08_02203 [Wallemia mellicola]
MCALSNPYSRDIDQNVSCCLEISLVRRYIVDCSSYNRFVTVAGRALRNSLNEKERAVAARRGDSALKYTTYENGVPVGFKAINEESK